MKLVGLGIAVLSSMWTVPSSAQQPNGREHTLQMAGCHDVTYYFHEDGERDYFNNEKPPAIVTQELVAVTEEEPEGIVLQHATIDQDGRAIPHWHEVWMWGEGGWTQSVYGRTPGAEERALRYRCTAPWSMNLWTCDIAPAVSRQRRAVRLLPGRLRPPLA